MKLPAYDGGVPHYLEFDPRYIAWQCQVLCDIEKFDYTNGPHEILLTGAAGSSKSLFACHLAARHMIENKQATVGIGRRSRPDLRETFWDLLNKHLRCFDEGKHYSVNETKMGIDLKNGSRLISRSWADRKSKKGRSLDLTMLVIEEATENDEIDANAINELVARVGRRKNWKEFLVIFLTNPDSPSHWLYKRFFVEKSPNRHVYHSVTTDNPFLPDSYIKQLESTFDAKMILRMRDGIWLDITGETIYHAYDSAIHEVESEYMIDQSLPIHFSWDFNIGLGKPLSCVFYQIDSQKRFHFFDEVVVEGVRTESALEEAANRGIFDLASHYICHGDASGKNRDTRSNTSDYGIIDRFMQKYLQPAKEGRDPQPVTYEREVPTVNPSIRYRHNTVNAKLKNSLGQVSCLLYPKVKTLREGFKLTKLRKGAQYEEDDSKHYQHITTAAGYGICWQALKDKRGRSGVIQL